MFYNERRTMKKVYLDTETCGLHGVLVLLQYAFDDGPVQMWEPWLQPVHRTLAILQKLAEYVIVGFNLTFDWFHIQKLFAILSLCEPQWIPIEHIDEIAALEMQARDCMCLKPAGAMDLMLHARKGPYQSLMQRDDIRIRRVPSSVSHKLAAELEEKVALPDIYFAKAKVNARPRWKVWPSGKAGWDNIVLKFKPSGSLKDLAKHALGIVEPDTFKDVELPKEYRPVEFGYAPFAHAVSTTERGWRTEIKQRGNPSGLAWPGVVAKHVEHWHTSERARKYAANDIEYTRGLDAHFDYPEVNDDDSVLACMVGSLRWRGYAVDLARIAELKLEAEAVVAASPINVNKPSEVRRYLETVLDDVEKLCIKDTSKDTLEEMWKGTVEPWGALDGVPHPVSKLAAEVFKIKKAVKRIQFCDKVLLAGRLHADFVIIGAKSSRLSGAGGVNAQAIDRTGPVRRAFPLAWPGYQLCGGDFAGFEVTIAAGVYKDAKFTQHIREGRDIHTMFASAIFGVPYEQVTKAQRSRAKTGTFLDMYGGQSHLLAKRLGVTPTEAKKSQEAWQTNYAGIGEARERHKEHFACIFRDEDAGAFYWREPEDAAYTLLGFPRFFTVENQIVRSLYELANEWAKKAADAAKTGTGKVVRKNGRLQTPEGAASSALFGCACGEGAGNARAAGNHEIQGTGAGITKRLQRRLWDQQPAGVHDFLVMPMNIHDEIMCPAKPELIETLASVASEVVETYRPVVPLLKIEWCKKLATWFSKDGSEGAEGMVVFGPPVSPATSTSTTPEPSGYLVPDEFVPAMEHLREHGVIKGPLVKVFPLEHKTLAECAAARGVNLEIAG